MSSNEAYKNILDYREHHESRVVLNRLQQEPLWEFNISHTA